MCVVLDPPTGSNSLAKEYQLLEEAKDKMEKEVGTVHTVQKPTIAALNDAKRNHRV